MARTKAITNTDDVIDSRDVIARIEDIEPGSQRCDCPDEQNEDCPTCKGEGWIPDEEEAAELATLRALLDALDGVGDERPEHGVTLIRDSYFKRYAMDLAEDCGMIQDSVQWPYTCIDWDHAARELQHDYSSIDFDGVEYWVRS